MTNNRNTPPRLPDELIAEIFRNETLSCRDLFHCSLVSSKFVETVNRCLYEHILVELNYSEIIIPDTDDDHVACDYTVDSWKLLRTLLEQKRLAQYMKEVQFDLAFGANRAEEQSGLPATQPQALSTFLRLGSNISSVIFSECWGNSCTALKVLRQFENVTSVGCIYLNEEEEEFCAEHFPHLKRLYIANMHPIREGRNRTNTVSWKSLEWLELFGGVKTITEFPSFSASSFTLRTLLVPLNLALELEYSQFPVLRELQLAYGSSDSSNHRQPDRYSSALKFWKSLCKSPSLHTLVFDTYTGGFAHGYEEALFVSPGVPESPIPSLRIIRFKDDVGIQRAHSLLSSPFASTLQSVIIPSSLAQPNANLASVNTVRAVDLWCESRGIELVLADIPRVSWTLLN